MIKIRVSKDKMKEIEKKHWEWFNKKITQESINEKYKLLKSKEEKIIFNYIFTGENRLTKVIKISEEFLKNNLILGKIQNFSKIIQEIPDENKKYKRVLNLAEFVKKERMKNIDIQEKIRIVKKEVEEVKVFINKDKLKKINEDLNKSEKCLIDMRSLKNITNLEKVFEKIFDYKEFSKTEESKIQYENKSVFWGRHSLLCDLGVEVCPYCNRQYINKFEYEESNKTTGDLDHFFIKSKYPYLALSLYNFIPSCQICNRTFKGDEDFYNENFSDGDKSYNTVYTYDEGFGDKTKFTVEFYKDKEKSKNYDPDVLTGNSNNFQIKIDVRESDVKKTKRIENSLKTFKLREVYRENHKDYIRELIRKAIVYNESRIDELFREYEGTLFKSREDVVSMIVSNYIDEEDLDKRVLAKLTKDISEELGLK